jgi:hypothetical protein
MVKVIGLSLMTIWDCAGRQISAARSAVALPAIERALGRPRASAGNWC